MAEGMLICDSVDHGDRVVRAREGSVSLKALLVHGCKDGSLAKLLLEGSPIECTATMEESIASHNDPEHLAEIAGDFWGGEDQPAEEPPVEAKPEEKTKPVPLPKPKKEAPAKPEPAPVAKITRADIEAALDGKKMRINDLAKKLKMGVPDLLGTFPTTGYAVVASGWVQSTIAITEG